MHNFFRTREIYMIETENHNVRLSWEIASRVEFNPFSDANLTIRFLTLSVMRMY